MEENELEEGEAYYYHDDDGASTDPDVELSSLSYIDEKIQDVLGHFQKDFEGGVSAENLGAKFGGYGSFLPCYQRSPSIWSHPRTPQKVQTYSAPKSPNTTPLEGAHQNLAVTSSASNSVRHLPSSGGMQPVPTEPFLDNRTKNDIIAPIAQGAGELTSKYDAAKKSNNGSDQKILKVLFKMGSDNVSARKNAAIYSGLGLDISPSSSPGESLDGSGELSPEFRDAPNEYPMTILKIMTSFPVPGGSLLSPLSDCLLHLTKREKPLIKGGKSGTFHQTCQEIPSMLPDETPSVTELKGFQGKKIKSVEKNGMPMELKTVNGKDAGNDTRELIKEEIDNESLACGELVSNVLKLPLLSCSKGNNEKSERPIKGHMPKGTNNSKASDPSKEAYWGVAKDVILSPDVGKDSFDPVFNQDTNAKSNAGNELLSVKGKHNLKTSSSDKTWEEKISSSQKDASFNFRKDDKGKTEKTPDAFSVDSDGFKKQKDNNSGLVEHPKQVVAQKAKLREQDVAKISQGKKNKKKSKRQQTKSESAVELPSIRDTSAQLKHKRKSSETRDSPSENKSDAIKSHRELSKTTGRECHRDSLGDKKIEQAESRIDAPEMHFKYKLKDPKVESEREVHSVIDKSKERPGGKMAENPSASEAYQKASSSTPLPANGPPADIVSVPAVPVVIQENWVCCDRCQKWRLLPFWTDPGCLPKKWLCSMLNWLPGKNKCTISEEETTKALNALYQVPITENPNNSQHDGVVSGMTFSDVWHPDRSHELSSQAMPGGGKKRHGSKDASNTFSQMTTLTHLPNCIKKNQQASIKSANLDDVNQHPLESLSASKFLFQHASKLNDAAGEKHRHKPKEKHKLLECYSDGANYSERSDKKSKMKVKREFDQDGCRTSKKIKTEAPHCTSEEWLSDHDISRKAVPTLSNELPMKAAGKKTRRPSGYSSSKDSKDDMREHLVASGKKLKAPVKSSLDGEYKAQSGLLDTGLSDKADFAAKKRKLKEWQQSQACPETLPVNMVSVKEEMSESELWKIKKPMASKSEAKESSINKVDGRSDKKGRVTKILLTGSREPLADAVEDDCRGGNMHQVNAVSQGVFDGMDSLKHDLGYLQPFTAATSSSSKVSGSHKSKTNFQEVKGSPVESVSSSPLRISNTEKLTNARRNLLEKDHAMNLGFSTGGSPRRCSDGEANGGSDRSGTIKERTSIIQHGSEECQRAAESSVMFADQVTYANQVCRANPKDDMLSKLFDGAHVNPSSFQCENVNMVDSGTDNSNQHNPHLSGVHSKDYGHELEKLNYRHHSNGSTQRKSGKSSSRSRDRHRSSRSDSNKGKVNFSDSFSEQGEIYPTKSSGSCRLDTDVESRVHLHHDDMKGGKCNLQEKHNDNSCQDQKNYKKDSMAKWPGDGSSGCQSKLEVLENSGMGSPMLSKLHADFNSKDGKPGATCDKDGKSNLQQKLSQETAREDERLSNQFLSDKNDQVGMASGRGRSQLNLPSEDKPKAQSRCAPAIRPLHKGSKSDVLPHDGSSSDLSKVLKQPKKPDNQTREHQSGLRQQMPNGILGKDLDASSAVRKEHGQIVLKEAKDLKHAADRLKSAGVDLERTGLYFEAALKFLHGASLLEPCNVESAKHGETTQSMEVYTYTAKLCEFCAHEYERCKEMAAAALAYKCMEVAYMRVIYSKHSISSKDRHELHTALQVVPPGGSPSSSASDVDNLNNQATLDKVALGKGVNSPQIAGSHVISARNRASYVRMLSLVQDVNSAIEAYKKSQIALAIANASSEEAHRDSGSILSVRNVLQFNFHDVEGLLHLVRLAMEAITC